MSLSSILSRLRRLAGTRIQVKIWAWSSATASYSTKIPARSLFSFITREKTPQRVLEAGQDYVLQLTLKLKSPVTVITESPPSRS